MDCTGVGPASVFKWLTLLSRPGESRRYPTELTHDRNANVLLEMQQPDFDAYGRQERWSLRDMHA